MNVSIRKFEKQDIPNKVKWINDPKNNTFLHYDIPLEIDKTETWFDRIKDCADRYDAIIEVDQIPVGLIGLLSIDRKHKKAEYYVTIGEGAYHGKGIAAKASKLLLDYAFVELGLNRIYLYTEIENKAAIKSYERIGFRCEGQLKSDIWSKGRFVDRYIYGITKKDFYCSYDTPIQNVLEIKGNKIAFKREDMIPFSFGGNKARKAQLFFEKIDRGNYDCIVTYGSSSSNHCRVIANMAAVRGIPCFIISPEETLKKTYNSEMMECFGAEVMVCSVEQVNETIENKLAKLKESGHHPYFIAGGGHGNTGTQAYVDCYEEIRRYEQQNRTRFDYIFHASGTGTTQAGLVCGQLINRDERRIVGISIARRNPRGRTVVVESVKEYLAEQRIDIEDNTIERAVVFVDNYIGEGYGKCSSESGNTIKYVMAKYGIPLDATYTGKAFAGMLDYIDKNQIQDKKILFIHTGGTPLFFDDFRGR